MTVTFYTIILPPEFLNEPNVNIPYQHLKKSEGLNNSSIILRKLFEKYEIKLLSYVVPLLLCELFE